MADVYRFHTPEGHTYDWHGTPEALQQAHPGAVITGRRITNSVGESTYEPYSLAKARYAEQKAAAAVKADPTTKPATKAEKPAAKKG